MADFNRRTFLQSVIKTAGAVAVVSLLDASLLRRVVASPDAGAITVKIDDHDELKTVGGAIVLDVPPAVTIGGKIILARTDENVFTALAAKCTHKGCTIGYDADDKLFECPCHGSHYNLDGTVEHGPAPRPLQAFPTRFAGGVVTIVTTIPADPPAADSTKK